MGHYVTGTRVGAQGTPSLLPGLLHSDLIAEAGVLAGVLYAGNHPEMWRPWGGGVGGWGGWFVAG